ncbi:MAG: EAL domain-containing protein [Sulfurimonas sp.]|nr:EAL domain-containing protein [Sulfurimonas sp.]
MKISIQKFIYFLVFILLSTSVAVFTYFYFLQQEKTASIILHTVQSEISEVNYIISKTIKSKKDAETYRPLLERIAVNNDFIAAIVIHDGQNVLLTTDPMYKEILPSSKLKNSETTSYKQLMKQEGVEDIVKYYIGNKVHTLQLMFVLDKEEINLLLHEKGMKFFILFALVQVIIIMLISIVAHRFIISPLELLRQFAYYQNEVPKAFMLQELEIIRYSMVETFDRLENEKKELYAVARTDSLSGLANRNALMEYLTRLIASSKRDEKEFAMLFLDLDHFKSVNDALGHNVGDDLLKKISTIIDDVLRPNDFVARVGGDEFVIIIQEYNSLHELTTIIDRIQTTLTQTWVIQTNPINISSSIGIAFYPKDGDTLVSLMKNSDIAMYEAKKNGRSRYHFFTEALNQRVQDTIQLEKDMKEALANDEFELYYQPKVDIGSGKIIAAEALIRWISPTKGMIPPDVFIPLSDENGFIVELGEWIYRTAIKQQTLFKQAGIDIKISINLSPKQFLVDGFVDSFTKSIKESEAKPSSIDVEITENLFYQHNDKNMEVLGAIHDYGVSISLDDFGTGYSSLSYLKDFPIDYLKIDKSFLDDFDNERGRVFIQTIVKMGQTLKMQIIAEGVETAEQLEYLKSIDCDQYQGYYCSKPMNVKDFENFYLEKKS